MPALVAKRYNPILRDFGERLAANGKRPKQIVVAIMRKLVHKMRVSSNQDAPSIRPWACKGERKTVSVGL